MGGHDHCAVYGCNHRREKADNQCGFYVFPKIAGLISQWIHSSGRQDLTVKSVKYAKICGCHFESGRPDRKNKDSVDYIPTLNLPQTQVRLSLVRESRTSTKSREWLTVVSTAEKENMPTSSVTKRSRRKLKLTEVPCVGDEVEVGQQQIPDTELVSLELVPEESDIVDGDHTYSTTTQNNTCPKTNETQTEYSVTDNCSQTDLTETLVKQSVKIKQYEQYIKTLKFQLKEKEEKCPSFTHKLIKDNKSAMFWTGLPSKEVFIALFEYFGPKAKELTYRVNGEIKYNRKPGQVRKVALIDEFFAVLVRLKVGLLIPDISQRLGISEGHFSKMFEKWIRFLREELECMTKFPSLHEVKRNMPDQFQKYGNTRIILDCTELFCQKPSSMKSQRQLWSNYKHHNTYKALIGISPDGSVVFVSNLYGGSCSDKFITKHCGILNYLQDGDCVMADRGFIISDILPKGVCLNLPPFRDGKDSQLTSQQVEETRRIASLRIHVERAIQRIKTFHILDGVMPLTLHHVVEDIFKVCAYLTNFQTPIISEE